MRYLLEDKVGSPDFLGDQGLTRASPERLPRRARPPARQDRLPLVRHPGPRIHAERRRQDQLRGGLRRRAPRDAGGSTVEPSVEELWERFETHLRRGVEVAAEGIDFHLDHMWQVFPELVLDLLCYGPLEKGRDASHGGVEFYDMCIDGTALATVADSFAAVEQRVESEGSSTWQELMRQLDADFAGAEDGAADDAGDPALRPRRLAGRRVRGAHRGDVPRVVKEKERRHWFKLIPGLFSWANTIPMGKALGATPNGRHAGAPISHGANPDPGFASSGAPTAMAVAVAAVQPGYGNTAPLQLDLDPGLSRDDDGQATVEALIRGHFALGGTQINLNVLNREKILEAHEDPSKYPDLIVRVTGFSAYFALLSKEFRQLVVDRIISGM